MKKLEAIARQFKDGMIDGKDAAFAIIRLVQRNKGYFNLQSLDAEEFDDFILNEFSHIISLLEHFDSRKASFSTFFYRALQVSRYAYRRKQASRMLDAESADCMLDLLSEEQAYRYEQHEAMLGVENSCEEEALRQKMERSVREKHSYLMNQIQKKHYHSCCSEKLEDLRRSACLILFLKSSAVADDSSIRNTSIVTGISEERLFSMMAELKEKVGKKLGRREEVRRARDEAFFLRRKYRIRASKDGGDFRPADSYGRSYAVQDERWVKNNERIDREINISPSNRDIGSLLNVSERKVAHILHLAWLKIDQIRLDGADK